MSILLYVSLIVFYLLMAGSYDFSLDFYPGRNLGFLLEIGAFVSVLALATVQMQMFRRYLSSFIGSYKARQYMFVFTCMPFGSCVLIGLLAWLLQQSGIYDSYYFLVLLVPANFLALQLLGGYQIWKIGHKGKDFVGGLSLVGASMCIFTILFPLTLLMPLAVGYVFVRANRYAGKYGFMEDK
ncbi:hypothetical protein D0T57_12315 [Dysgonomonas sp. 511]|nr:hypothetical protein [Dysgonomonas sp. 511]